MSGPVLGACSPCSIGCKSSDIDVWNTEWSRNTRKRVLWEPESHVCDVRVGDVRQGSTVMSARAWSRDGRADLYCTPSLLCTLLCYTYSPLAPLFPSNDGAQLSVSVAVESECDKRSLVMARVATSSPRSGRLPRPLGFARVCLNFRHP